MRKNIWKCALAAAVLISAIALGSATPAAAQDQGDFTYVSSWAVPRSQWAAFEKQDEASSATLKKLVADGTIIAWGSAAARVHQEDGYTHSEWFTATSRAALLKALEVQFATAANDIETTRRQLLDYCKLDTFAMLRVHETLFKLASLIL